MTGPTDPPTEGGTPRPDHPDELLAGHVENALAPAQREEVERHLATCATCTEEVALARRARAALASLPELDVPMGVTRPVVKEARRGPSRLARVGWAAGVAAAAAVIGVFAWSALRGGGTPPIPAAAPTRAAAPGRSFEAAPSVTATRQSIDYDAAAVQALATRVAGNPGRFDRAVVPPAPQPSPSSSSSSNTLGAAAPSATAAPRPLPCIQGVAGSSPSSRLVQLIRATYQGKPAYIGVYAVSPEPGRPPDLISVWVVSTRACTLLNYTSAKVSS